MNKDELREAKRAEQETKTKAIIDRASRLKSLLNYPEFQEFIDMVREKRRQYDNILHNPKPIGALEHRTIGDTATQTSRIETFKYTQEEDSARLKEAQLRYDTFTRVINLVDDFVRHAEKLRAQMELQKQKTK